MAATILTAVGYDPHRKYRATAADYLLVAAVIVATAILLGWAVLA